MHRTPMWKPNNRHLSNAAKRYTHKMCNGPIHLILDTSKNNQGQRCVRRDHTPTSLKGPRVLEPTRREDSEEGGVEGNIKFSWPNDPTNRQEIPHSKNNNGSNSGLMLLLSIWQWSCWGIGWRFMLLLLVTQTGHNNHHNSQPHVQRTTSTSQNLSARWHEINDDLICWQGLEHMGPTQS